MLKNYDLLNLIGRSLSLRKVILCLLVTLGILVISTLIMVQTNYAYYEKTVTSTQGSNIKIAIINSNKNQNDDNQNDGNWEQDQKSETLLSSEIIRIPLLGSNNTIVDEINWAIDSEAKIIVIPGFMKDISKEELIVVNKAIDQGIIFIKDAVYEEDSLLNKDVIEALNYDVFKQLQVHINRESELGKYANSIRLVTPPDTNLLQMIVSILEAKPDLDQYDISNLLHTTANPVGDIGKGFYEINILKAQDVLEKMNNTKLNNQNIKADLLNSVSSVNPTITASNVTSNSITWNVIYSDPNAYGNRLELYNFTTEQWSDTSGTFYTKNGAYTTSNLLPGNTYLGRLTYLKDNKWVVVDRVVTTTALKQAEIAFNNLVSSGATISVVFPANAVYGNKIQISNTTTGDTIVLVDNMAKDGTYKISNLNPGDNYTVSIIWYEGYSRLKQVYFKTPTVQQSRLKYEYDKNGRLLFIRESATNRVIVTFAYDDNGNLLSIQK